MTVVNNDYNEEDVIHFLREEFERIITQYPRQKAVALSDAQALAIWFLHQETGIPYEDGNQYVIDDTNDCGVDIIWIDKNNCQTLVGQVEYDTTTWSRKPGNQSKAIETFKEFRHYLDSSVLPEKLHEAAKLLWREARRCSVHQGFPIRYVFITPKYFSPAQENKIRESSGTLDYEFFIYDTLIERGQEFLDGQTGMSSFKILIANEPLKISYDFGSVYIVNVGLKEINKVVEAHERNKRLESLFASNVRGISVQRKEARKLRRQCGIR